MPIYKRCSRCGKRLPSGTTCECQARMKKESQKVYDRQQRDKRSDILYHSDVWKRIKEEAKARFNGVDIYSYYILHKIEYGHVVHHIIPVKTDWEKRYDIDNLIYLNETNHQYVHKLLEEGNKDIIPLLNSLVEKWKKEAQGGC